MSYSSPAITPAGLSIPSYDDIRDALLADYQGIFGQDVYIGTDSALYQWVSVVSLMIYDVMLLLQMVYNNQSPQTAVGAGLDSIVKINGIRRLVATYSTCQVVIAGTPGTTITGGIAQDSVFGYNWDIPNVTIPNTGSISVVATCETIGAVNLSSGQLNVIATPTLGWTSVTNTVPAVAGKPVETDAQLRARQAISVELPSISLPAGTLAAVAAVPGVSRYYMEENPTGVTDGNGVPSHSISVVAEGGQDVDVATAIYNNRGIGCGTYGTTSVSISDPHSGVPLTINFFRPTYETVFVTVNAHLLAGGTSSTLTAMQSAINAYLNGLQIGETVSYGALVAVAMSVNPSLNNPIVSVRSLFFGLGAGPSSTADINLAFNQVALGVLADIVVNSV